MPSRLTRARIANPQAFSAITLRFRLLSNSRGTTSFDAFASFAVRRRRLSAARSPEHQCARQKVHEARGDEVGFHAFQGFTLNVKLPSVMWVSTDTTCHFTR